MLTPAFLAHACLIALQAPAPFDPARPLPSRIVMLKWGTTETAKGAMRIGMKTLAASRGWDAIGFGRVCIDFNHNTVPGNPAYQGEPAKIAGMATPRVVEGVGLVFDDIEWTEDGRANRAHYPDVSPTVLPDADGEIIFVHSAALARNGAVPGLQLFSMSAQLGAQIAKLPSRATFEGVRDPKQLRELLTKLFGLPVDADNQTVAAAIESLETDYGRMQAENLRDASEALPDAGNTLPEMDLLRAALRLPQDATIEDVNAVLRQIVARQAPGAVQALSASPAGMSPADRAVMTRLGINETVWRKFAS